MVVKQAPTAVLSRHLRTLPDITYHTLLQAYICLLEQYHLIIKPTNKSNKPTK